MHDLSAFKSNKKTTAASNSAYSTELKESHLLTPYQDSTPKPRRQLEFYNSPYLPDVQKDLFAQLLGTETKYISPLIKSKHHEMSLLVEELSDPEDDEMEMEEEEEYDNEEENMRGNPEQQADTIRPARKHRRRHIQKQQQHQSTVHKSNSEEGDSDEAETPGRKTEGRKRRRKSNAQLKLLKQQFDKDDGWWNKDRILQMAEMTGLSESQVYKWCWDQKKKGVAPGSANSLPHDPAQEQYCANMRKVLGVLQEEKEEESSENNEKVRLLRTKPSRKESRTKRKSQSFLYDEPDHVSKRLNFN